MSGRLHGTRLYPTSSRDRWVVLASIALGLLAFSWLVIADRPVGYYLAAVYGLLATFGFVLVYALQDRPEHAEGSRFALMVDQRSTRPKRSWKP